MVLLLALSAFAAPTPYQEEAATFFEEQALEEEGALSSAERPPWFTPYNFCHLMGMVWDGRRCRFPDCFPTTSSADFLGAANEVATNHNRILANDFEKRGDTEITEEDTREFLWTAAEYVCDGDCDPARLAEETEARLAPLLEDGFDAEQDLAQILEWDVEAGGMSPELADELNHLVADAVSGAWSEAELQARIEDDLAMRDWRGQDLETVLSLQAVSRASGDYWAGARGRPNPRVVDAVAAVGWGILCFVAEQPWFSQYGTVVGSWASAQYMRQHVPQHRAETLRWEEIEGRYDFREDVEINGEIYSISGNFTRGGGVVSLVDSRGERLDARELDPGAEQDSVADAMARGGPRRIPVPIWTRWGFYIIWIYVDIHIEAIVHL